ncbi:MAG: PorT family protein [Bacteroidetes bacterium]|nr:PorT family protein [Bacteroidota bacterium]
MKTKFLIVQILLVFGCFGQKYRQERYKNFDKRLFHFGFMLGVNSSDFTVYQKNDAYQTYGLVSLNNDSQPGGQLGILATMKLGTPILRLRFIPTLSFQERVLNYKSLDSVNFKDGIGEERVNSTSLDFPLMLQFRTKRYNNFTAYALIGGQYSIDLQSQEKASQSYIDPFIKIKKNDFQGQIGGGVEFFAPYFKFGLELKYSHGFKSSFIQDWTPVSNPINQLYNKGWWFSIIFEG